MDEKDLELIYVWDAYCGWCYGFSKSLRSFHENHPELPLTVLCGGLFVGDRKVPIKSFSYIPEGNKRISQLTGAEFGTPYQRLLTEGNFEMDSEAAAIGYIALSSLAPKRAVNLASDMQRAFYYNGQSLSDPTTYQEIANAHGLDPNVVFARLEDPATTSESQRHFSVVKQLAIDSYPTLLIRKSNDIIRLGGGIMTAEKLEANLATVLKEQL